MFDLKQKLVEVAKVKGKVKVKVNPCGTRGPRSLRNWGKKCHGTESSGSYLLQNCIQKIVEHT